MIVVEESTGKQREVKRSCAKCRLSDQEMRTFNFVLSPMGVAHHGKEYGVTDCGQDATKPGWLWPL